MRTLEPISKLPVAACLCVARRQAATGSFETGSLVILLYLSLFGMAAAETTSLPASVRVAAIQCYSRMGKTDYNRKLLTALIQQAAARGARIAVLPECAVHGYMDPGNEIFWTAEPEPREDEKYVGTVAESIPGPSSRYFAKLAKQLEIYLCLPLIEREDDKFYNSQLLLSPKGEIVAHHRKSHLWPHGDGRWASPGNKAVQVVDTEFGRLGLMICFELHSLPKKLAAAKADIVLYSVGWFGPNTEDWFSTVFPRKYVKPYNFAIVAANWSADPDAPDWPGIGYSAIIDHSGKLLRISQLERGNDIVFADLPIRQHSPKP